MARRFTAVLAFLPFMAAALAFPFAAGSEGLVEDGKTLTVRAIPIANFRAGSTATRFGKLEFLGGLVMATPKHEMGAMSAIRLREDGEHVVIIMDTGFWATGRLTRDEAGKLSGLADFSITEMKAEGNPTIGQRKEDMDAEGLAIGPDGIDVSYEVNHRIDRFPLDGFETAAALSSRQLVLPEGAVLRRNGGLEAIARAPLDSPLKGALIGMTERSYDKDGNFYGAIEDGDRPGLFTVKRHPPFDITDAAFLKDGSLLILERRFGLRDGIGCRIRRIAPGAIKGEGELVDGEVIFEADFSDQIDNMEGLDAYVAADGSTRILLISDDNHSLLERNVLIEFKLVE